MIPTQLFWDRVELERACIRSVDPKKIENQDDEYEITCLCKYKLRVKSTDLSVGANLMRDGYWEIWITLFLARVIPFGGVAIDVGANLGYYTMMFSDLVGPLGKVIAIEPQQELCRMLMDSAKANNVNNIDIYQVMAFDKRDKIKFYVNPFMLGDASFIDRGNNEESIVDAVALDDIVSGPVDFVKIDVEGSEEQVIDGMQRIIKENPEISVALEWVPERISSPEKFLSSLRKDFDIYNITLDSKLVFASDRKILMGPDWDMLFLKGRGVK